MSKNKIDTFKIVEIPHLKTSVHFMDMSMLQGMEVKGAGFTCLMGQGEDEAISVFLEDIKENVKKPEFAPYIAHEITHVIQGTYPLTTSYTQVGKTKKGVIDRVRWFITQRWVLKEIARKRYCYLKRDKKVKDDEERKIIRSFRNVRGVEKEYFINELINDDTAFHRVGYRTFNFFDKYLGINLIEINPNTGGKFVSKINDIIESSLDKGYLRPLDYYQDEELERLKLTKDGYDFISPLYYLRLFYNNKHVQLIIATLIQWGIPIIALWFISKFFDITIHG